MRYPIKPCPAPRQTRKDKWKPRPCVVRYREFRDAVRALGVTLPEHPHVTFHIPMPKSWPLKKQNDMIGQPHRQTPDVDNLFKALADAVYASDSHIWDARMTKFWSISGFILVEEQVGK